LRQRQRGRQLQRARNLAPARVVVGAAEHTCVARAGTTYGVTAGPIGVVDRGSQKTQDLNPEPKKPEPKPVLPETRCPDARNTFSG
jgi:hypothetical protein